MKMSEKGMTKSKRLKTRGWSCRAEAGGGMRGVALRLAYAKVTKLRVRSARKLIIKSKKCITYHLAPHRRSEINTAARAAVVFEFE